jgi:hypothetical protein
VTSRDEIGDFFLRGRQSAHVVRRGDFVRLKGAHEPTTLVRHDEVGKGTSILTTVSLRAHEVSHHELARAGDHVRQIGLATGNKFVGGLETALFVFGLRVWEAVHCIRRGASHVQPTHDGKVALLEEEVHEVIELAHRTLNRVEGLGVRW